jgi:hypothetical protein
MRLRKYVQDFCAGISFLQDLKNLMIFADLAECRNPKYLGHFLDEMQGIKISTYYGF